MRHLGLLELHRQPGHDSDRGRVDPLLLLVGPSADERASRGGVDRHRLGVVVVIVVVVVVRWWCGAGFLRCRWLRNFVTFIVTRVCILTRTRQGFGKEITAGRRNREALYGSEEGTP